MVLSVGTRLSIISFKTYFMVNSADEKDPRFNNRNQQEGIKEEAEKERAANPGAFSPTGDELSLDDSIRTQGQVSGSTFGMESNTAKFSNLGPKNQARKGDVDMDALNKANREAGNGGTQYADYLNQSQNEFISGTGQFEQKGEDDANQPGRRPFDAMQGKQEGSGGHSEK
jgi:hypothetical protein